MYWIEALTDFLHQFNRGDGISHVYTRDLIKILAGQRFMAFGRGGQVFNDPFTKEPVVKEFYIIKPQGYPELHVRVDKFKEIPFTAEEEALGRVLYGE